jgi:DNA-binding SARP family transcriptional activator
MRNGSASTDTATVRLLVLGRLELEVEGKPHALPEGGPAKALLAWLALHPGIHHREHIAERLWPGGLRKAQRDSLKTALGKIRRTLPPSVCETSMTVTRHQLGLDPEHVRTDIDELATHMSEERLDDALALVRGELLAGIGMDWVDDLRGRQRAIHVELLTRLFEAATSAGDHVRAVELARRHAELEPLDEQASLTLMHALVAAGRPRLAIEETERLRRAHARAHLPYEPSPAVRTLLENMRDAPAPRAGSPREEPVALLGFRWDGHLCRPPINDPHDDFAVLHTRIAFSAPALPETIRLGCVAADATWIRHEAGTCPGFLLRAHVDAELDPADERVFAVDEVLLDGEPLERDAVEPLEAGAGRGVSHVFIPPASAAGLRTLDLLARTRVYVGSDRRVPVTAVLPHAVNEAEFRLTVDNDLRVRRISVGTSQVTAIGRPGAEVCGKLVGAGSSISGAIARFAFPLREGSAVHFAIERDAAPTATRVAERQPRTRPAGRAPRRV